MVPGLTQAQMEDLMKKIELAAMRPMDPRLSQLDLEVLEAAWGILDALDVNVIH